MEESSRWSLSLGGMKSQVIKESIDHKGRTGNNPFQYILEKEERAELDKVRTTNCEVEVEFVLSVWK